MNAGMNVLNDLPVEGSVRRQLMRFSEFAMETDRISTELFRSGLSQMSFPPKQKMLAFQVPAGSWWRCWS